MSLELDENHKYTLNGRPLDGVTSVLSEAGLISGFGGGEWFMNRGSAVHLACELYDRGTLDDDSVDPEIAGYLESWKRFRLDTGYEPVETEVMLSDSIYLYAGKVDRLPLVDLKSGAPARWHKWQLAAYWNLCRVNNLQDFAFQPQAVYLDHDGGTPTVKTYTASQMREALKEWFCILQFVRIKRKE